MEEAICDVDEHDASKPHQRADVDMEATVPCTSNFQVHQDLDRAELQRYAVNIESASGHPQAVVGRSCHYGMNKEEDIKLRKRQKTFSGPQSHSLVNLSFPRRPSGQELPNLAFGKNLQGTNLDSRAENHHDVVRLAMNTDFGSTHPGPLTLHSNTSVQEQPGFSLDCSPQDVSKCTVRNNLSTQGSRTSRMQADHNSCMQGGRTIGLHSDHSNSILGSRTTGPHADHCSSSSQESKTTGLQANHINSNIHGGRKTGQQVDHNCSIQGSRVTGSQSNHNSNSSFQGSRVTGPQVDHSRSLIQGSRVTGLYAELVKELETQVTELRKLLASREEVSAQQERRIKELEQENEQLKTQMRTLEEQNDLLSSRNEEAAKASQARLLLGPGNSSIDVTDSNIQFLKGLIGFLETNVRSQVNGRVPLPPLVPAPEPKMPPTEVRVPPFHQQVSRAEQKPDHAEVQESSPVGTLRVSAVTGGFQYWMNTEESSGSPAGLNESCGLWEDTIQETLPDGTPAWASPVEENGRPKLELIPNSGVYITHHQLDDLSQISNEKPKLMTRRLLDYFFSRETLARSSATGQRIAHNNTTMEKPIRLPVAVVGAIKEYVTNVCGRGCNFNAVINSKCGTSRRAVKKMSIRIDWMEGGGQPCPRTEVIAEGSLSPCRKGAAMLQNSEPYQDSVMSMDNPPYS
ncbi:uncharacterized protein [Pleurodeles waltl]|uniref:uncharacterized protein n=1 Tax=Pleurodeles waltl TaxID=8319 RepID=UPI0037096DEE